MLVRFSPRSLFHDLNKSPRRDQRRAQRGRGGCRERSERPQPIADVTAGLLPACDRIRIPRAGSPAAFERAQFDGTSIGRSVISGSVHVHCSPCLRSPAPGRQRGARLVGPLPDHRVRADGRPGLIRLLQTGDAAPPPIWLSGAFQTPMAHSARFACRSGLFHADRPRESGEQTPVNRAGGRRTTRDRLISTGWLDREYSAGGHLRVFRRWHIVAAARDQDSIGTNERAAGRRHRC